MSRNRPLVVIGLLGTTLDSGKGAGRWEKWRPSVALCQQPDCVIDRFELLYEARFRELAEHVASDIGFISPETTLTLHALTMSDPWDFEEVYGALHDFARGYPFAPEAEDYLVHITTGTHVAQICLFLLTEARELPARLLQTAPPRKQIASDPGSCAVIDLDLSRYDRIARRFAREQVEQADFLKAGIATRNPAFNATIARIERVALRSRAPLLLLGPTGAGKSFLAKRIYELKRARHRLSGAFVEVNCATLRGDGAMSALFGHKRGAYTGAQTERAGLLRSADKGLLFLDEIGELGPDEQAMLLKAIEDGRFLPVGADKEVESRFELIAGTHRDLAAEVAAGRFREDLYARINLWTFRLPGLAERREDIEPNLDFELERHAREQGQRVRFNAEARRRYLDFATGPDAPWRGNFRELGASVLRMATLAEGGRIDVDTVTEELDRLRGQWGERPEEESAGDDPVSALLGAEAAAGLDRFDRVQLAEVLRVCRGSASLSAAGRELFAVSRAGKANPNDADRLRKYLARFGLEWGRVRGAGG